MTPKPKFKRPLTESGTLHNAASPAPSARTTIDNEEEFNAAVEEVEKELWRAKSNPNPSKHQRKTMRLRAVQKLQTTDEWSIPADPPCEFCKRTQLSCRIFKPFTYEARISRTLCGHCRGRYHPRGGSARAVCSLGATFE